MRKLRMLMMMGCIPMILGAEEYKEPEKINLNKGWEFSQVGKRVASCKSSRNSTSGFNKSWHDSQSFLWKE